MIVAGLAWLIAPRETLRRRSLDPGVCGFFGAVIVCSLVSPWSEACLALLDNYYKYFVFYLMLVTVIRNPDDLKRLILAFVAVVAIYMLHSLLEYFNGRFG